MDSTRAEIRHRERVARFNIQYLKEEYQCQFCGYIIPKLFQVTCDRCGEPRGGIVHPIVRVTLKDVENLNDMNRERGILGF